MSLVAIYFIPFIHEHPVSLTSKVILELFQWNIDISFPMTSVAKNIKAIGKKPGAKMLLVFGKRYRMLF